MSVIPSNMMPLNRIAPTFTLKDTLSGKILSLAQLKSPIATIIVFMCNHCPYVKHIRPELINVAAEYIPSGISFIAISSNDKDDYPEDSPENMKKIAEEWHFPFPYLYDETQEVAKAYDAACTPDFFVFDGDLKCVYRGQFDESRPGNGIPVTGKDLRNALDCLINGEPIPQDQRPSIGCSIKWKRQS
jgi:thiol-disulfide isomerase/thioredoxin